MCGSGDGITDGLAGAEDVCDGDAEREGRVHGERGLAAHGAHVLAVGLQPRVDAVFCVRGWRAIEERKEV